MPIVAFLIGFGVTFFIASFFIRPLFRLLIYFFMYVVLPTIFGLLLFAVFFAIKAKTKNSWFDFGLLLLIVALFIASFSSWGFYFLAYIMLLMMLVAFMLSYVGFNNAIKSYKSYKNSDYYKSKKAKKKQDSFNKNFKKAEILLENIKNKELAKAIDDNDVARIKSRSESLKNAFIFLANKHKIIINNKDIKTINKITEYFALSSGDELMCYESAYKEILARHKMLICKN